MKKLLAFTITIVMLMSLTACFPGGGVKSPEKPSGSELSSDALHLLWEEISGCWVCEDRFVYITWTDDGPAFLSGIWDAPIPYNRDAAQVDSAINLSNGLYTLSLSYPPVTGDAADSQDLQSMLYTLALDVSTLDDGILRVEAPEDRWRDYTYAAVSYSDAWDALFIREYASFAQMQSFWTELTGRWVSQDGHFVEFDQADNQTLLFMTGRLDAGAGRGWGIYEKTLNAMGDIPMTIIISYPPFESELEGSLPADTLTFELDMMEIHTHNRLPIRFEGEDWIIFQREG